MINKSTVPLMAILLITGTLILIFRNWLEQRGFDCKVLSGGNLFICFVTLVSVRLLSKGLDAEKTQVFMRNAYSGIMVKLFACAAAAFTYILVTGKALNKPAFFACMGLYLVYTFAELWVIMKQSNAKKNG